MMPRCSSEYEESEYEYDDCPLLESDTSTPQRHKRPLPVSPMATNFSRLAPRSESLASVPYQQIPHSLQPTASKPPTVQAGKEVTIRVSKKYARKSSTPAAKAVNIPSPYPRAPTPLDCSTICYTSAAYFHTGIGGRGNYHKRTLDLPAAGRSRPSSDKQRYTASLTRPLDAHSSANSPKSSDAGSFLEIHPEYNARARGTNSQLCTHYGIGGAGNVTSTMVPDDDLVMENTGKDCSFGEMSSKHSLDSQAGYRRGVSSRHSGGVADMLCDRLKQALGCSGRSKR